VEDKFFDLLEKLYIKVDTMEKNMATRDELEEIRQSMATRQDIVRLEDKMDINHKALYDGYKLNYEKLNMLEKKVDEINDKVEKQDVEIRVIKGAR